LVSQPKRLGGLQTKWVWLQKFDEHWPWVGLPLHSKPDDVALFNASVRVSVGDGSRILFWADPWIGGLTVTALARAVVALVKPKLRNSRSIKDGLAGDPWVLDIAGSLSVDVIVKYLKLWAAVRDVALDVGSDTYRWKWTSKGSFTLVQPTLQCWKVPLQWLGRATSGTLPPQ
jgi:hypothetical protein